MNEHKALKRRMREKAINYRNGSVVMTRRDRFAPGKRLTATSPKSKNRRGLTREVPAPLARRILKERPWCERGRRILVGQHDPTVGTQINGSTQVHEKTPPREGSSDEPICVALCRDCHSWIHDHLAAATVEGWLEHRGADVKILNKWREDGTD